MASLQHDDTIAVLDLGDGENRFAPDWMVEVAELLEEAIETARGIGANSAAGKGANGAGAAIVGAAFVANGAAGADGCGNGSA